MASWRPFGPPDPPYLKHIDVAEIDEDVCSACGEDIIVACEAYRGG